MEKLIFTIEWDTTKQKWIVERHQPNNTTLEIVLVWRKEFANMVQVQDEIRMKMFVHKATKTHNHE